MHPPSPGPLAGIKVLDLSRILAGPWATQLLGDLGADVIKIEQPGRGDDTRIWGPPFLDDAEGNKSDAAYFATCNRNKRSVSIDFSTPEGAHLLQQLAQQADVVVENFKRDGLVKYGLDYASIAALNPAIIYCSITGFGQTGPYAHRAGYDVLIQGMGGLMGITGKADEEPGGGPVKVGVAVTDLFTGMYAANAILAALMHRQQGGGGQHIDLALLDSMVAMLANQASNWLNGGIDPGRLGNNHPNVVPYRVYPVKDGHVIIACGNDSQFQKLCHAFGRSDLAEDEQLQSNEGRVLNRQRLDQALEKTLAELERNKVISLLEEAGVPCGPINSVADVFADDHVKARQAVVTMQRPDGSNVSSVAFPPKMSGTPAVYRLAPPVLGADTEQVLEDWLGLDTESRGKLRQQGVLG